VGYLAGQIARIVGCDTVGIAGSDAKCKDLVSKLGFHDAINYQAEKDLAAAIKARRPSGVDVFFDNVGGKTLNAGVKNLKNFGRAVIVGRTADYTEGEAQVSGLSPSRRLTLQTFIVWDYPAVLPIARLQLAAWLRDGSLVEDATMVRGIENSAQAFSAMFERGAAATRPIVQIA
jgi:NADPH-dependent curcumin reductase CurA